MSTEETVTQQIQQPTPQMVVTTPPPTNEEYRVFLQNVYYISLIAFVVLIFIMVLMINSKTNSILEEMYYIMDCTGKN